MNVKLLIEKLSKPYWMAKDPKTVIHNLTPAHIGQLNLMWVMLDRIEITQGFFDNNLCRWELAGRISMEVIDGAPVREYACLFSEDEFHQFILRHSKVFTKYLPMRTWNKHFKAKV